MKTVALKVYEKGQVVLPLAFREKLHLRKGSRVRAFEYGGVIYLLPNRSFSGSLFDEVAGIIPSKPSLSKELLNMRRKDFA